MQKVITVLLSTIAFSITACSQKPSYTIIKTFHIASPGGWDYLAVNDNNLYVSHGLQVNILHKETGDSIGVIDSTTGVHGIAFINALNKGYTSNGRLNNVSVFDLKTFAVTGHIATGKNPDAIMYDSASNMLYTCNGSGNDVSVIDPATEKVLATIPVGGKPETAVSDGKGKLFVNIEDKNEVVEIDMAANKVLNHWPLKGGEEPTGLAIDKLTNRLFVACDEKLVVLDAKSGKVVTQLPIGEGCDGAAFDEATNTIYTSNGEGSMTVIHEESANKYNVIATVPTKRWARTIALDATTHRLFLPTADFEKPAANAPANERPKMIAGSFQVLVIEPNQK